MSIKNPCGVTNAFCPTGKGGGVDATCGSGKGTAGGKTSHKDRLEKARSAGKSVLRTKDGYKEYTKEGTTFYDRDGYMTSFEPTTYSHTKRFGVKNAFCPTGKGGGQDNTCGGSGGGGASGSHGSEGFKAAAAKTKAAHEATSKIKAKGASHAKAALGLSEKAVKYAADEKRELPTMESSIDPGGKASHERQLASMHQHASEAHHQAGAIAKKKGDGETASLHFQASKAHKEAAGAYRALLPDTTKNSESPNVSIPEGHTMTKFQRQTLLAGLTANCSCDKTKERYSKMSDDELAKVFNEGADPASGDADDDDDEEVTNAKVGVKKCPECGEMMKNGKCDCGAGADKTVTNTETVQNRQALTVEEWEASMPPQARAIWDTAKKAEERERRTVVNRLVVNVADPEKRKAISNKLMKKTLPELVEMLEIAQPVQNQKVKLPDPVFIGANANDSLAVNRNEDDVLPLPSMADVND